MGDWAAPPADVRYRFDALTYVPLRRALYRGDAVVRVGDRGLDILLMLLRHPCRIVTMSELLRAGWGERAVSSNNVTVQLAALRRALGRTLEGGAFIRTVSGRGYMLQVPVSCERLGNTGTELQPAFAAQPVPVGVATSSFIGRQGESTALAEALATSRLVSVTGVGGVGKTRLVQEHLRQTAPAWGARLYVVDLAPVGSAERLVDALASALPHTDATEAALVSRLYHGNTLLVLDNAEHLAGAIGTLLGRLLARCPGLRALVTSRQMLNTPEEHVLRLQPFKAPAATDEDREALLAFDCVRLFVDRATTLVPGFCVAETDLALVAGLCRRVDGIPLAIEMLIPRLRALTLQEIEAYLAERFQAFALARSGAPPRQQTLLTMMQWSWDLLNEAEQEALRRMTVFRRPATLALLARLGELGDVSDWGLIDAVGGLVANSLATPERAGSVTTYALLQTTRDFVLSSIASDTLRRLRQRHATEIAVHLEQAHASWHTTKGPDWYAAWGAMADDLRAALDWTLAPGGDAALAGRLLAASVTLWWELPGAPIRSMREYFDQVALSPPSLDPARSAWFHIGRSWRAVHLGDKENRPAARQAVAAARQANAPVVLGAALLRLGTTLLRAETLDEADAVLEEAETMLRRTAPGKWLALALGRRADVAVRRGALLEALPLYEEASELTRSLGYGYGRTTVVSNMTEALFELGDRQDALGRLKALRAELPLGLRSPAVATLAAHLVEDGQFREALDAVAEVLAWVPATGMVGPLGYAAEVLGLLLAGKGRFAAAATLAGFARHVLPSGATRFGSRRCVFDTLDRSLRQGLSPADLSRYLQAGEELTPDVAEAAMHSGHQTLQQNLL